MSKPESLKKAESVCRILFGKRAFSLNRFHTGLAHYVFHLILPDDGEYVLRIARPETAGLFCGALHWLELLRPLGVPVPGIVCADVDGDPPFMLLEYLPGEDLGHVYTGLSSIDKDGIARAMVAIGDKLDGLPPVKGYGYLKSLEDPGEADWLLVCRNHLERSREGILTHGIFPEEYVDRAEVLAASFSRYLEKVAPTPFLDDATTKNVLIHEGRLSGIVDVDTLGFGDPLYQVALTRMSLLAAGQDTEYTDRWFQLLGNGPEKHNIFNLYTLFFCVDFMAEVGGVFNKDEPVYADPEYISGLKDLFEILYAELTSG